MGIKQVNHEGSPCTVQRPCLQLLLLILRRGEQRGQLLRLVLRLEVLVRRRRRRGRSQSGGRRDDGVSSSGVDAATAVMSAGI